MIHDKQLNKFIDWTPIPHLTTKSEQLLSKYIELTKDTRVTIKLSNPNKPVINYSLQGGSMIIPSCKCCTTNEIQVVEKKCIHFILKWIITQVFSLQNLLLLNRWEDVQQVFRHNWKIYLLKTETIKEKELRTFWIYCIIFCSRWEETEKNYWQIFSFIKAWFYFLNSLILSFSFPGYEFQILFSGISGQSRFLFSGRYTENFISQLCFIAFKEITNILL